MLMKLMDMIIKYILYIYIYMNLKLILLLFILVYSVFGLCKEGFTNDNTTFKVCRNTYNEMDNDYSLKINDVSPLPKGFYSSLLNVSGARDDRRYLEAPICDKSQSFNNDYFINNKITDCPDLPGNCDQTNNVTKDIYKNNTDPLEDPFFLYGKVNQNNKIMYSDEITQDILSAHDVNVEEIVKRSQGYH